LLIVGCICVDYSAPMVALSLVDYCDYSSNSTSHSSKQQTPYQKPFFPVAKNYNKPEANTIPQAIFPAAIIYHKPFSPAEPCHGPFSPTAKSYHGPFCPAKHINHTQKIAPKKGQYGPKMTSKMAKIAQGSKVGLSGPRWPQDGPKIATYPKTYTNQNHLET